MKKSINKKVLAAKKGIKKVKTTINKAGKSISKTIAVTKAIGKTMALAAKDKDMMKKIAISAAASTASLIADIIPYVSNVKAAYEAAYGIDPFTREKLDTVDQSLAAASIALGPFGKVPKRGKQALEGLDEAIDAAEEIVSAIEKSKVTPPKKDKTPGKGTGEYSKVGGHHIHAKAGFKKNINYDPKKGFSISQKFMKENGLNHQQMTNKQRELFKELNESGRANTLQEHTRIAVEALIAGGATRQEARDLVAASLKDLRQQGVREPSNIPWYK